MIDGRTFLYQPIINEIKPYEKFRKIAIDQSDGYTTSCSLDYPYFKENYNLTVINLSKQQALRDNPEAMQQINFTENLERAGNITIYKNIKDSTIQNNEVGWIFW